MAAEKVDPDMARCLEIIVGLDVPQRTLAVAGSLRNKCFRNLNGWLVRLPPAEREIPGRFVSQKKKKKKRERGRKRERKNIEIDGATRKGNKKSREEIEMEENERKRQGIMRLFL
jgi:hypothetical protein